MKKPNSQKDIPNSKLLFPVALRELMDYRNVSYRRLATRTKLSAGYLNHLACGTRPVPSDTVVKSIARALRVKPEYFFEYRQRSLEKELYKSPDIADQLYDFMVADKPLPRDIRATLEKIKKKR